MILEGVRRAKCGSLLSPPFTATALLAFSTEGLIIIDLVNSLMDRLGWDLLIIACLTLGLAPYRPPHVWEKLVMLSRGNLRKPLDWFDLFLHGAPWVLLVLKILLSL